MIIFFLFFFEKKQKQSIITSFMTTFALNMKPTIIEDKIFEFEPFEKALLANKVMISTI